MFVNLGPGRQTSATEKKTTADDDDDLTMTCMMMMTFLHVFWSEISGCSIEEMAF